MGLAGISRRGGIVRLAEAHYLGDEEERISPR